MSGFQFKQFFIAHHQCAMKVNTDGILLGALADVRDVKHIVDLGTGSGLVAVMLAQRSASNCWNSNRFSSNCFMRKVQKTCHYLNPSRL